MPNARIIRCIITAFVILVSMNGRGQSRDNIDSLLARGTQLLKDEDPDQAQKTFEKALKIDDRRIDAMMGMASADIQRERWGKAADWYELVMKQDANHVPANYGYAVCKRELGKFVGFLQRPGEWRKSEKHFKRVLELDSAYQDVLLPVRASETITMKNTKPRSTCPFVRRRSIPNSSEARMGVFKLYDCLVSDRPYEQAEAWLKSRSTLYDRYFLG